MFRWLRHISLLGVALFALHSAWAQEQSVRIAQGSSVSLRADAANALSYLWFRDGEPINGSHDQRITVSDEGVYTVMALGDLCDSDMSDPVRVIVDPGGLPVTVDMQIRNVPDRPMVLVDGVFTHQLFIVNNGTRTATGVLVNVSLPHNVRYESTVGGYTGTVVYNPAMRELTWSPGDIIPGQSESLTLGIRAESEGLAAQLAVVASHEEDSNPADNEARAAVSVIALKIPNVFTPNGDGVNDYFEIRGLELFPAHRLTVFNRWGNEVYKSSNYQNDWNGANLSAGTYYYALELKLHTGHTQTFKGFITLIRNTNN